MSRLPSLLAQLAEAAGDGAALSFAGEFGGRRIFVPKKCDDEHAYVRILGRPGADLLCSLYGGESVVVPLASAGTLAQIRRRLAAALEAGATINEAAQAAGVHHRTAQRMRRRLKDPRQGDLF